MTGPLNGAKPAAGLCRKAGCKDLVSHKVETRGGERTVYYCSASAKHLLKVAGNMYTCPKENRA